MELSTVSKINLPILMLLGLQIRQPINTKLTPFSYSSESRGKILRSDTLLAAAITESTPTPFSSTEISQLSCGGRRHSDSPRLGKIGGFRRFVAGSATDLAAHGLIGCAEFSCHSNLKQACSMMTRFLMLATRNYDEFGKGRVRVFTKQMNMIRLEGLGKSNETEDFIEAAPQTAGALSLEGPDRDLGYYNNNDKEGADGGGDGSKSDGGNGGGGESGGDDRDFADNEGTNMSEWLLWWGWRWSQHGKVRPNGVNTGSASMAAAAPADIGKNFKYPDFFEEVFTALGVASVFLATWLSKSFGLSQFETVFVLVMTPGLVMVALYGTLALVLLCCVVAVVYFRSYF